MNYDSLFKKCLEKGYLLMREEIIYILALKDRENINKLLKTADEVRKKYCGDDVHLRALLEISNVCIRDCNYCGLRASNKKLKRYYMAPEEILEAATSVNSKGLRTLVIQSGENPYYTGEMVAGLIKEIKGNTDLAITLSLGERTYEDYKMWKEAGADRYLLRHETANCSHYKILHPDSDFYNRRKCFKWLRKLDYQVGAGCMIGSPEQTLDYLADDIEFIRDTLPDMIGIGPFIPHPETPMGKYETGDLQETLKMIALTRIVTRDALIPATTAIGSIEENGREMALMAGADVIMINFTPLKYREHYEIYPNKRCIHEEPEHCLSCIRKKIKSIGRTVSEEHGHSRKRIFKEKQTQTVLI